MPILEYNMTYFESNGQLGIVGQLQRFALLLWTKQTIWHTAPITTSWPIINNDWKKCILSGKQDRWFDLLGY